MIHLIFCLVSYLIGSIPFGLAVAKAKGVDLLSVGSGNIGATNVGRTLGKGPAVIVFILDALKGAVPALLLPMVIRESYLGLTPHSWGAIAGTSAVVGHMFSPWLKFKGGKGVATAFGAILAFQPAVALISISGFFILVAITKIVSLGSLFAVIVMLIIGVVLAVPTAQYLCLVVLGSAVTAKHFENIKRLLKGEEKKFAFRSKKGEAAD